MDITYKLKRALKVSGWNLSSLSKELYNFRENKKGISQPALTDLINNKNISYSRIEEIANIIGMPVSEIICEKKELSAIISHREMCYEAHSLQELKDIVNTIEERINRKKKNL